MTAKPGNASQGKNTSKQTAQSAGQVNTRVNQQKGTRTPGQLKQSCPNGSQPPKKQPNTKVVCDIASLTLHDKESKKQLTCSSHDRSPLSAQVPKRIAALLASNDLVMELVSDYELVTGKGQMEPEKKKFVELTISRTGKGSCPNRQHPSVAMTASDSRDSKYNRDWKTKAPDPVKIPARPMPVMDRATSWILPFWNFRTGVMDLNVKADGCGVGVESPVNHEFKSLVRIYPNDTYELTFKLPPFKKWEKEKSSSHWDDKKMASGSSSSSTFGKKTSESSYKREKEGDNAASWSSTRGESKGGSYQEKKVSYKDGKISSSSGDGESSDSPMIELKHNGEKYDLQETLANTVNVVLTIMSAILGIKDLLDIVPKVGWTYKFDASILEGSIKGTWGNRIPEGADGSGPRYTAVQSYFDIDVELKLFEVSFELGFGFELKIPPIVEWFDAPDTLEIILKAAIQLSLDASVSYKAKSSSKENHLLKIESKPKAKVYLEFKVTAFGKGLESEAGVRGGFECEASFHVSFSHAPDFNAKAGSTPLVVYAQYFVDFVIYDKSGHWEHTLVDEHTFYEGPLPPNKKVPATSGVREGLGGYGGSGSE